MMKLLGSFSTFCGLLCLVLAQDDCPEIQDPKCADSEIACPSGLDESGCPLPDYCAAKTFNNAVSIDGKTCPDLCPVNCDPDDKICPGGTDEDRCPLPDVCMPKSMEGKMNCEVVCPIPCNYEYQMSCPGGKDNFGCPKPDFCQSKRGPMKPNGEYCPALCPVFCGPGSLQCWGGLGPDGCPLPDTCIPAESSAGCPLKK